MSATPERHARMRRLGLWGGAAAVVGLALSIPWSQLGSNRKTGKMRPAVAEGDRRAVATHGPGIAKLREAVAADRGQGLSTNPGSPGYDPVKLALLQKNPFDLYESEPRSGAWASAIEGLMRPVVEQRLKDVPGGKMVAIDCRTSSCAITAEAPKESDLELQYELQAGAYGQYETFKAEETEDGTLRFTIVGLIGADKHDPGAYAAWLEKGQAAANARKPQRMAALKARRERRAREQESPNGH